MSSEQKIQKAVAAFNKYKGIEANAELVEFDEKHSSFKVKFSGHMCFTCGFHDYFDDFRFELEDAGILSSIENTDEKEKYALVSFSFRKKQGLQ